MTFSIFVLITVTFTSFVFIFMLVSVFTNFQFAIRVCDQVTPFRQKLIL